MILQILTKKLNASDSEHVLQYPKEIFLAFSRPAIYHKAGVTLV